MLRKGLAATYSRGSYTTTTIGKTVFDGRVRNGNGSDHCFMATKIIATAGGALGGSHTYACQISKERVRSGTARSLKTTHRTGNIIILTIRELKNAFPVKEKSNQAARPISTSQLNTSR